MVRNRIMNWHMMLLMFSMLMILSMLSPVFNVSAKAEVSISQETFLNAANAKEGSTWQNGMCLAWVKVFWESLGGPSSTDCCARHYSLSRIVSTSRDNIPIGADVFLYDVRSNPTVCGTCGGRCGHIGIYMGDGKFISTLTSNGSTYVRIRTISQWESWGYSYAGWGWHDGIRVESIPDIEPPVVTSARISNATPNSYSVICEAKDNVGVNVFRIGTWNDVIGIDAAHWEQLPAVNGSAVFIINIADYNYIQNTAYHTNVYAIDGKGNVSVAVRAGDIVLENTPPAITKTCVENITTNGYDVICEATDNISISKVQIGTWHDNMSIDDAVWQEASSDGSKIRFQIKIDNYGNIQNTTYHTNAYAFDQCGNASEAVRVADIMLETMPPVITNAYITNVSSTGYDVVCEATDNNAVCKFQIGTWNSSMSIDNAVWQESNTNGSTVFHVSISDFGMAQNVTYYTNVYAFDLCGNVSEAKRAGEVLITPAPTSTPAPTKEPIVTHPIEPTFEPTYIPTPIAPTKVTLNESGTVNLKMGKTLKLTATVTPSDAQTALTWKSSKPKYATVENGVVRPVKPGATTITVTTGNGLTASVKVKVVAVAPTKVKLNKSGTVTLKKGKKLQLTATLVPDYATTTLTWTSSDKKVAKVDKNGKVTALKKGTATITVKTENGKKAKVKIKVK